MATQKMMAVPAKMMAVPGKTMAAPGLTLEDLTLGEIRNLIVDLAQQGSTFQHQIGALYNHVVARRLAELAGYENAQAYFSKNVKALSQSTLGNYGIVARNFTVEDCMQYGMYRLRALLRYLEAIHATVPTDLSTLLLDVPKEDGKVEKKPFAECSVDDVERATRVKRAPPVSRVPIADQARLLFIADSISTQFEGVADVRLSSRTKEGKTLVSLQDVPMTELTRLMQAIQDGIDAEPTLADEETSASA
ncbi:hypothetical protein KYC5002_17890 [Archangium violaceum]|uniref:hypothetical protein n=1 Tax=Archangium violaceum TaxID=83451 RepID=UPI002B2DFDF8|nr:hypothetical protein KYC5002_17890 [Archangium gephyra]